MKAAVYYGRGDIRIESVPEPSNPRPGEVVLEVTRADQTTLVRVTLQPVQ